MIKKRPIQPGSKKFDHDLGGHVKFKAGLTAIELITDILPGAFLDVAALPFPVSPLAKIADPAYAFWKQVPPKAVPHALLPEKLSEAMARADILHLRLKASFGPTWNVHYTANNPYVRFEVASINLYQKTASMSIAGLNLLYEWENALVMAEEFAATVKIARGKVQKNANFLQCYGNSFTGSLIAPDPK